MKRKYVKSFLIGFFVFSMLIFAIVASAAVLEVGSGKPYSTIQAAVSAAGSGDTIIVWDGTYYERVVVNKEVTIKAAEGSSPIVDGGGGGTCFGIYHGTGMSNVTIDGFEIQNATYGIWTYGAPSTYSNITISNNTIHDHGQVGIYVTSCTISNLAISDNAVDSSGVGIGFANYSTVNGLTIENTRLTDNNAGLSLISEAFSNVVVNNCYFAGNAWEHIDLGLWSHLGWQATLSNIHISACQFLPGPWCGVWVEGNAIITDVVIDYNEFLTDQWGVYNSTTSVVDAQFNWWGDVSGPNNPWNYDGLELVNYGLGDIVWEYALYNPWIGQGGFVTGGGTIWSEEGDYAWAPNTKGIANFGFVAKYKKGASVPEGNTNFMFNAGNLHFRSSEYDWLVIAGEMAQFKGKGTIEGVSGVYKFKLWAKDDDLDTFRIKIWEEIDSVEVVVYDNGDDPLTGGNIFIHKEKKK